MSTLRLATLDDLGRVCRTLVRAFAVDPLIRWMLPDDDAYAEWQGEAFFRLVVRRWMDVGEVMVTDDCAAVAVWGRPDPSHPSDAARADMIDTYQRFDEASHALMGWVSDAVDAHRPPQPYWYLQFLGTHPDWQGQGLGTALLAHRREHCDQEGTVQYLETATDDDIAYYRARGFEVCETFDVHDPTHPVTPSCTITTMSRTPHRL